MKLSKYFTLEELTYSAKGQALKLPNIPDEATRRTMILTATNMDKIREHLGHPIIVSSCFRSPAVNLAVGGSATSYHLKAQAVDFTCPGFGTPYDVARAVLELTKKDPSFLVHEVIHEFTQWVHVSFPVPGELAKNRIRTARKVPAPYGKTKTIYIPGILPK